MVRTPKNSTTVYLEPDELDRLRRVAQQTGAPMAHHVRRAVRRYLDAAEKAQALLSSPGFDLAALPPAAAVVLADMLGCRVPGAPEGWSPP